MVISKHSLLFLICSITVIDFTNLYNRKNYDDKKRTLHSKLLQYSSIHHAIQLVVADPK